MKQKTGFEKYVEERKKASPDFAGEAIAMKEEILRAAMNVGRLQWTKEPPTKPGWYWARPGPRCSDRTAQIVVVDVDRVLHYLEVWSAGCDVTTDFDYYDLWAGPIEAPPLPEGEE